MKNRNKFLATFCLFLAQFLVASKHKALADEIDLPSLEAPDLQDASSDNVENPEALLLRLQRDDLRSLMQGIINKLTSKPIRGYSNQSILTDHRFGQIGVHGIAYEFKLKNVNVSLHRGFLRFTVELNDARLQFDRITLNKNQTRWCSNLPIYSGEASIPVTADVSLLIQDYAVDLKVSNQQIGLTKENFRIGKPSHCHALPGFNWLVRHLTPWFTKIARERIKESISTTVIENARRTIQSLNDFLQVNITLPFAAHPVPAFYATVRVWPAEFVIEPDVIRFGMGADVFFDPDFRSGASKLSLVNRDRAAVSPQNAPASITNSNSPTYAGIKRSLLAAILNEANKKGLFRFDTDATSWPQLEEFLSVDTIGNILPDANTRFAAATSFSLVAQGASTTEVQIEPLGPGGLPILMLKLRDFRLSVLAEGQPYYELVLDLDLGLKAGYDRDNHKLVFGLKGIHASVLSHNFSTTLMPPARDARFDDEAFAEFIDRINSRIAKSPTSMMAIELPELTIGDRRLEFLGSHLREDAVTLDGHIVDARLQTL